jgi:hypothetical protein
MSDKVRRGVRERERERERDGGTEGRQTDRKADRQTDRQRGKMPAEPHMVVLCKRVALRCPRERERERD